MVRKKQAARKPIFEENLELGVIAMKAGHRTVKSLAKAVRGNNKTVTRIFRNEIYAPFLEKRVADALGVSVKRLRALCNAQPSTEMASDLSVAA